MKSLLFRGIIPIALLLVVTLNLSVSHKFYVSLTEIRVFQESSIAGISIRVFPDDLNVAIEKIYGKNPQISSSHELKEAGKWITSYLSENFHLWFDGKALPMKYLGKNPEADAVWIHMEVKIPVNFSEIKVESHFLTDFFEDQKNIIQVYCGSYNKGALLDRQHTTGIFAPH